MLAWYDFRADGSQLTLCRVALLTCMLTTKRSMDGFSKVIFKSDFDKIKGTLASKAALVESMLETAWKATQASQSPPDMKFGAYGNLQVRMMLLLLNKQKFSRDANADETYQEIVDDFQEELVGKMALKQVPVSSGPAEDASHSTVQDLVAAAPAKIALLQNSHIGLGKQHLVSNKVVLLQTLRGSVCVCLWGGNVLLVFVRYTNKDYEFQIFTLERIGDSSCIFKHYPLFDPAVEVETEFCDLKTWKLTKAKQPQLCSDAVASQLVPQPSAVVYKEYVKASVQSLLWEAFLASSVSKGLHFCLSPMGVYTKQKFNKGSLLLYPLGSVSLVTNGVTVMYQGQKFAISNYKAPSSFETDAKGTLVPFNWIYEGDEPEECNLLQKNVTYKGLSIPVLYNPNPIAAKVQLLLGIEEAEEVSEPSVKKQKTK